jgi:hypothetical protein
MKDKREKEAIKILEEVSGEAKEGIIYETAQQYLAYLYFQSHQMKEAHRILLALKKELPEELTGLLHQSAFEVKDWKTVAEMAGPYFQLNPHVEVAVKNSCAYAALKQPKESMEWLQSAIDLGLAHPENILKEPFYDSIRSDPVFLHLKSL